MSKRWTISEVAALLSNISCFQPDTEEDWEEIAMWVEEEGKRRERRTASACRSKAYRIAQGRGGLDSAARQEIIWWLSN